LNTILVQATKEWQEFQRDRLSLALAFLLPLFSLLLFGYGIRLESKNIPIVIKDLDNTSISREFVQRLYATNIFIPASIRGASSPTDAIDRGFAKAALVIPKEFAAQIFRGKPSPVQVMIDGTDIANTQIIYNTIQAANLYFQGMLKKSTKPDAVLQIVVPHLRLWFNPGREETLFIVPGAFGLILWMFPALLTAVAASREKEQETIVRVYAANPNPLGFLLGKTLVYFVVAICMSIMIMLVGALLFGLRLAGDPTPLLVATPLYVLTSVLFGLLLGTFASSQTVAVQATSTIGFFPCLLLSGFVYPISNIPFPLSLFSILVPARYFVELTRDAFVRGTGWSAVGVVPLILVGFCTVFLVSSWLGVRRMQVKD
jgi:ABC-2 type transport system permease protein